MRRMSFAVAAGLLAALSGPAHAQDEKKFEEISFKTFDGILIKGSFYPSTKGSNAPVVMFLHKLGSDRTKGDWNALAEKLQKANYAVLSFDFRGHGQSKTIFEPEKFWSNPMNTMYLNRVDVKKKSLNYADFKTGYVPCLVNDIVAARYDLDNRNDSGQCNTSNIIVIGAEDGASLGFLWMATEHARPGIYQKVNLFQLGPLNTSPASDDLAGAIWLTFSKSVHGSKGSMSLPYSTLVSQAAQIAPTMRDRVPMWFAVGQNDSLGMTDANYLYDSVLKADSRKDKLDTTFKKPIAGTNLRGAALLGKSTTNDDIEKYIKRLVEKRPNAASKKRNASDSQPTQVPLTLFGFPNYPY